MPDYFHGGPRGLRNILPPEKTGAASCSLYGAGKACRVDRVYMTTIFEAALIYAAMHPSRKGVIYQVRPVGEIEPDTDYLGKPGESVCAPQAKVVRVFKIPGKRLEKIRKIMLEGRLCQTGTNF